MCVAGTFTQLPCLLLSYCSSGPNWHSAFFLLQGKSGPELLSGERKSIGLAAVQIQLVKEASLTTWN